MRFLGTRAPLSRVLLARITLERLEHLECSLQPSPPFFITAHRFLPRNSYMYVQYSHPHRTYVDLLSIDRRDARPTHTHRPAARRRIYCLSRRQLHCVCCRCLSSYPPRLGSRQLPSSVAQDSLAAAFADLLLRTVLAAKCYPFPATAESLNGRTGKPGHPR